MLEQVVRHGIDKYACSGCEGPAADGAQVVCVERSRAVCQRSGRGDAAIYRGERAQARAHLGVATCDRDRSAAGVRGGERTGHRQAKSHFLHDSEACGQDQADTDAAHDDRVRRQVAEREHRARRGHAGDGTGACADADPAQRLHRAQRRAQRLECRVDFGLCAAQESAEKGHRLPDRVEDAVLTRHGARVGSEAGGDDAVGKARGGRSDAVHFQFIGLATIRECGRHAHRDSRGSERGGVGDREGGAVNRLRAEIDGRGNPAAELACEGQGAGDIRQRERARDSQRACIESRIVDPERAAQRSEDVGEVAHRLLRRGKVN